MNAKILILLILILIISTMQQRNSEKFTNGKMSKKYRDDNCTQNNNLLNKVHKYESYSCNIDDSKTNDQVINDRMNCRSFNEKKIYLKNDVKGWCKSIIVRLLTNFIFMSITCIYFNYISSHFLYPINFILKPYITNYKSFNSS